ncbi:hypothetical protein [Kitasatospora sp. CB01950]|uniref:hypothetical protein n=1 Tax=Kitasatospora sp. CB01950 TaxID=1703930 RepID=UPI000938FBA3|nr:hypothetical protein [Kitasatospora sp. CB01950]OKJ16150.1 hypothetical protein AMK19_08350 [Kitasatospora sp. CB01950]
MTNRRRGATPPRLAAAGSIAGALALLAGPLAPAALAADGDTTPPTLSFPATVPDPGTQFPPAGNGQVTTLRAGQSGDVLFTATDDDPAGVACLRWSFDPQFATGAGWTCGSAMPTDRISVTPGHWGTSVLYVQARDAAGNVSPVAPYSFSVPWAAGAAVPQFGDVNGDRTPDVVTAGPSGDLRVYSNPAAGPQYTVGAAAVLSPGGDSWANYRTTHRGGTGSGWDVDALIVHKDGSPGLWTYRNPGNTGVRGVFDSSIGLNRPACAVTAENPDCTGYAANWSTTRQLAAIGDPMSTDVGSTNAHHRRTGLVTTEINAAGDDAALWYYPSASDYRLTAPVRLAASGWKDRDLISPGDWAAQGRPGLWARDRVTGEITAYTLTVTTITITDEDGITISYPTVTSLGTARTVATGITAAAWPRIGSDGDLVGNGAPSLWGITPEGVLQTWTGWRTGTPADPGFTLDAPTAGFSAGS